MAERVTASRLEQQVDALTCAALKVGTGGRVMVGKEGGADAQEYTVDRVVMDDQGYPSEVWLSTDAPRSTIDRLRGSVHKYLMRVSRNGGDVRRCLTRVTYQGGRMTHTDYREDVGAPRMGDSVATFKYPQGLSAEWLRAYEPGPGG